MSAISTFALEIFIDDLVAQRLRRWNNELQGLGVWIYLPPKSSRVKHRAETLTVIASVSIPALVQTPYGSIDVSPIEVTWMMTDEELADAPGALDVVRYHIDHFMTHVEGALVRRVDTLFSRHATPL